MTNDQKPTSPATPTIPEVTGIGTAVKQIEAVSPRLSAAIAAASSTEAELNAFRVRITGMKEGMEKSFLVEHQAELEAKITDNSRKAVSDAIKELQMHMGTIATLAQQVQAKHGLPVVTVKRADKGTGLGNITSGNMDRLKALLTERGFSNIQVTMLDDSYHREISALSPTGVPHTGRYTSNIERQWY